MRIITGKRRGMKLKGPRGIATRPTEDRIKESVFNILGNVRGGKVLDLFSGSGGIGLEFLSRGAEFVYFVDNNKETLKILKENIKKSRLEAYEILEFDYIKSLEIIDKKSNDLQFDYVYIDPPYDKIDYYNRTLSFILENRMFLKSLIILEARINSDIKLEKFHLIDKRQYRDTIIYFIRRQK